MDSYEIRLAIASDVAGLYDLLKEYVVEQKLEEEFKNSRTSFEEHFNQVLFKALVIEIEGETKNQRQIIGYRGLEQNLIQHTKKMSRDADIDNMLTVLTPLNASYRRALENEGMDNRTSSIGIDVWVMPNQSSTSTQKCDDYITRDGTERDLSNIYHLLEELAEVENITALCKVSKEGKGLGKALLRATLQACKKRSGDGFIFMIQKENKTSQSLFRSLHAINLTQSTRIEWINVIL